MKKTQTKRLMHDLHSRFLAIFFISFSLTFIGLLPVKSQIQDLARLASGELVYSSILYDSDENVYGYFYLYERSKEKDSYKNEFVFLDKNLNTVSNGEYTESRFKNLYKRFYDCTLVGDHVVLTKLYIYYNSGVFTNSMDALLTTFQIFSLKDKTVSPEMTYKDGLFSEISNDQKVLLKEYKNVENKSIIQTFANKSQSGFFMTDYNKSDKSYLEKDLKFFDENRELKWNYVYNPDGKKDDYIGFSFLHVKENKIYLLERHVVKKTPVEYKIVALDFATGNRLYDYVFETDKDEFSHTIHVREIENNLMICGNYSPFDKKKDFKLDENLGFYRIILDDKGKEISNIHLKWNDVADTLKIDDRGRVEKDFRLQTTKIFFFKDQSISILTEKYKPEKKAVDIGLPIVNVIVAAATYRPEQTTDFVLFNLDNEMKLKNVHVINKDFTKFNSSDYLFSQYIKDDSGAVFFYSNDLKDKRNMEYGMILGINTIIDGQLSQEKIPIYSKKKYSIQPLPAKEGYVMLREYNEQDKYNQIRLERLNY